MYLPSGCLIHFCRGIGGRESDWTKDWQHNDTGRNWGAARVDPGIGVQKPGYMIREFTLKSSCGENVRISSFRGHTNLVLVFPGYSDAMRAFLEEAARHSREFSEQDTAIVVVVPYGLEGREIPIANSSPIFVLHDKLHAVYRRSGATDENGRPIPVVYLTDRFGEIVSICAAPGHLMPPNIEEILSTLEFLNHQCPECEPPEWPR